MSRRTKSVNINPGLLSFIDISLIKGHLFKRYIRVIYTPFPVSIIPQLPVIWYDLFLFLFLFHLAQKTSIIGSFVMVQTLWFFWSSIDFDFGINPLSICTLYIYFFFGRYIWSWSCANMTTLCIFILISMFARKS